MANSEGTCLMVAGVGSFCREKVHGEMLWEQAPTEGALTGRRISRSKKASAKGSPMSGLDGKDADRTTLC